MKKKILAGFFFVFCLANFLSCGNLCGYGVVLWSDEKKSVFDGEILKIYVRSNISQVYVVSRLGSKQKFEMPIWSMTPPESKKKAEARKQTFSQYQGIYAYVALDGLPIRAETVNTSKQIYRLRKDEMIRVLYEVEGQAVTNGHGNLEGKWLRVLTEDGTEGWCFSYNLRLFKMEDFKTSAQENSALKQEQKFDSKNFIFLQKKWVPQYYGAMAKKNQIVLEKISEDFGLVVHFAKIDSEKSAENFEDSINSIENSAENLNADFDKFLQDKFLQKKFKSNEDENFIQITLQDESIFLPFNIEDFSQTSEREFNFSQKMKIVLENENALSIQYPAANGKIVSKKFIAEPKNFREKVLAEQSRRKNEFQKIFSFGPNFSSTNYGKISFFEDQSFSWRSFDLIGQQLSLKGARGKGIVFVKNFLSEKLKSEFDGVLTFKFSNVNREQNFLYKITKDGLRLEVVSDFKIDGNVVQSRDANPTIIFFVPDIF